VECPAFLFGDLAVVVEVPDGVFNFLVVVAAFEAE